MDASSIAASRASSIASSNNYRMPRTRAFGHGRDEARLPHLLGTSRNPGVAISRKKGIKAAPGSCALASEMAAPKGAISQLQEYVQCSHAFHVPSNYSVLQWTFESKMADAATLEFRAIVAFLLDGVPHHVAGTWHPKKKDGQRDTAERTLEFFVGKWGEQVCRGTDWPILVDNQQRTNAQHCIQEEELLKEYCKKAESCGGVMPSWSAHWDGDECQVIIEMMLLDVPHHFAGPFKSSEEEARADASRRVLYYLHVPGFQDAYELDPSHTAHATRKIPQPPTNWVHEHDSVADGALEVAERKTAIMRVQNRLQQTFSRELRPGLSVWTWSYEMDPNDEEYPALCRASVSIPVVGKIFTGAWVRGQRDAQLDTIQQVTRFLDGYELDVN